MPRLWLTAFMLLAGCGGDYWLGGASDGERLSGDIVLTGSDSFERADCLIVGNGYGIRAVAPWTGHLVIRRCMLVGVGSASTPAIALEMSESASAVIEDSTFDRCGAVRVNDDGTATTAFRNNVVLDTSVVALDTDSSRTTPAFEAVGTSTASKLFQGNRIGRSGCTFASPNWLVGGDSDAESNILVGLRAGIVVASSGIVVRGNYVHNVRYDGSGDESALSVSYETHDALIEHNVLRHGDWVVRTAGGDFRYNALVDADSLSWIIQPLDGTRIHHNVMMMCTPRDPSAWDIQAGIEVVNARTTGIEIRNNTLDGGGAPMRLTGPAVTIDQGCFLGNLSSNAFIRFPFERNDGTAAAVRAGVAEPTVPSPLRLGYADYNLFHNPEARDARNYAVAVEGLVQRIDAGFARNDVHAGGPVDEQVEPEIATMNGPCFPWSDADIVAGTVKVSAMLAAWRSAYAPLAASPLLGAGSFIGAVGDGTSADDRFGTFGR
jgi:hypothetical protein